MKITYRIKQYLVISIITYTIVIFFLTMLRIPFSIYYFTVTGITLFIVFTELNLRKYMKEKEEELITLDWLLSEIRHRYYVHGMVDEAMKEALDHCKEKKLRHTIERMLSVLSSPDPKCAADIFNKEVKNRYYGMLLTLSLMVMEFGDKSMDGQSLYLMNLKSLRTELHIELKNMRTTKHHFVGLTFIILFPMMTLKLIEAWGLSNLDELSVYYNGTYQILFYISIFVITIILYYLFYLFKAPMQVIMKEHMVLNKLAKRSCFIRIRDNYEDLCGRYARYQQKLLSDVGETLELTAFLVKRIAIFLSIFVVSVTIGIILFGWDKIGYCLLVCVTLSFLGMKVPVWLLRYRRHMMQMYMEEEVLQYNSILMMLMYMDRISTYELLESMEEFSVIFKAALKACLTEYESGQMKALQRLKERVSNPAMEKLVDNIMMCDEIGVEKALDELTLEQAFYNDKRKQQSEYNLEKKGILCRFLAFVPLVITIAFYLILPFITVSINKLLEISQEIATGK
ncbi:MAG: hypothetical protein PUC65_16045 [Clostridiales bacterium]|nr:hypothetical protein [Clostridiales bacterium]